MESIYFELEQYEASEAFRVVIRYLDIQEKLQTDALITSDGSDLYRKQGAIAILRKIKTDLTRAAQQKASAQAARMRAVPIQPAY